MKHRLSAWSLAATIALAGGSATAAVIDYSAVIDLDPSMYDINHHLTVPLPGGPISIGVGDTLQGVITFANNGRITVFDSPDIFGSEWILGSFAPDPYTTAFSSGTFQLLGVQGDYLGPTTIGPGNSYGALAFSKVFNYTNTSFSFSGVAFSLTYLDLSTPEDSPLTTHVTPDRLMVPLTPSQISEGSAAVPEPETWAMLIVGFGLLGGALRRRGGTLPA